FGRIVQSRLTELTYNSQRLCRASFLNSGLSVHKTAFTLGVNGRVRGGIGQRPKAPGPLNVIDVHAELSAYTNFTWSVISMSLRAILPNSPNGSRFSALFKWVRAPSLSLRNKQASPRWA